MVLIHLELLSDAELRYIARQEGFSDWESLDRDELIEQLQEKYEDEDDQNPIARDTVSQKRFLTSLTDFGSPDKKNGMLPGLEELPKAYNETSVHLLLRDPQWAYAYWSLSAATRTEITSEMENPELLLRVSMHDPQSGEKASFDISIGLADDQWNINLPRLGGVYGVSILWRKADGSTITLAQSKTVETFPSYWEEHYDEISMDKDKFNVMFSSVLSNEGEVADNPMLRSVARILSKGVLES
ncbi:MAG: DUF4912 domain-containing protein [Sphaerochaeta sp.]|jgi:hypothetical protein|nr:DUF4912 domain-containing protein [Sphaerochaeta sp.]MCH3921015.1 DUF4912 domain-containing protein [Sphaerochaeta sp.]MCI2045317.1 DUF4912 domain-containing protein [Sphaerochaeta sp.]MCI2076460.1 DUF4912 domain-containing protein [Sphaerochaeta sp.]MCI2097046.1 DUF4912 domain-containing protein [Sphaerochaeta sp.]